VARSLCTISSLSVIGSRTFVAEKPWNLGGSGESDLRFKTQ
jgi:hypothetical protein